MRAFIAQTIGWWRVRHMLDAGRVDDAIVLGQALASQKLGCGDPNAPKIPAEDIDTMERLAKIIIARSAR